MCSRASFNLAHLFFAGANIIIKLTLLLLYKLKNRMRGSLLYLQNWSQSGKNKLIFGFGAPDIPQNRSNFFGNSKKNFFCWPVLSINQKTKRFVIKTFCDHRRSQVGPIGVAIGPYRRSQGGLVIIGVARGSPFPQLNCHQWQTCDKKSLLFQFLLAFCE